MGRIQDMIDTGLGIAYDDSHGYSQYRRWPWQGLDFDCSSFTYWCANQAGYNVPLNGYTGTIYADFTAAGFTAVPYSGNVYDYEPGTILLAHNDSRQHVEIYIGDGMNVGAHIAETGDIDGVEGDQTGIEISVAANWGWWDWALIPPADFAPAPEAHQELGEAVNDAGLWYRAHVQNLGWCEAGHDGQIVGTTGYGLRWEALKCKPPKGWVIEFLFHIQNVGWVSYICDGDSPNSGDGSSEGDPIMGTVGEEKRIEAVGVRVLKRPEGDRRHIEFRTHQQDVGWKAWTPEGFFSGCDGQSQRQEAFQMKLVA